MIILSGTATIVTHKLSYSKGFRDGGVYALDNCIKIEPTVCVDYDDTISYDDFDIIDIMMEYKNQCLQDTNKTVTLEGFLNWYYVK